LIRSNRRQPARPLASSCGVCKEPDESQSQTPRPSTRAERFSTETKEASKTTELIAFVLAVAGVAVTAVTVDDSPDFGAERAWLYITILTVYMVSRGLAKAGSAEPYDEYDD
jgi:hypothetical protein